jgi:hypothetical protein
MIAHFAKMSDIEPGGRRLYERLERPREAEMQLFKVGPSHIVLND